MRDKFLSAMGNIDEKYVAEFEKAKKARKRAFITRMTAIAACLCLVVGGVAAAFPLIVNKGEGTLSLQAESTVPTLTEPAPTEPEPQDPVPDDPEPAGPFTMLSVTAENTDGEFIASDTDFIVETENGSEKRVREHLYISGGPEYTVSDMGDGKYRVSLQSNLSSGSVVSLSYANDGVTEYSWAFETERKLEVVSHTPRKNSYTVATDTVIELTMSMVVDERLADYVTITPELNGRWDCISKTLRFIPDTLLADDTKYTVTVSDGYSINGYALSGYTFSFSTGERERISVVSSPNYGGMLYFRPGERIVIDSNSVSPRAPEGSFVRLYAYDSPEDAIAKVEGDTTVTPTLVYEMPCAEAVIDGDTGNMILDPADEGYYLVELDYSFNYDYKVHAVVCVHDVCAYALTTERDIVIWADDKDIPVRYGSISTVTNENGIALLRSATDGTGDAGFVYLGEEDAPLVVAVPNYSHEKGYPNGYIYTDKPIYKTDDTVSFFGVIPTALFYDEPNKEFTVKLLMGGTVLRSQRVTPDADGTVHGEFTFTDMAEGYCYVSLYYGDTRLDSRSVEIEDYFLQNYLYEVECERRYVSADSALEFTVAVTHISGVTVSGKRLRARANDVDYYATTDMCGVAHFSIPYTYEAVDTFGGINQLSLDSLSIYSGDTEEGETAYDSICHLSYYIIRSGTDVVCSYGEDKLYTYKGVYLRPEQADWSAENVSYEDLREYGATFSGTVTVQLYTETREIEKVTADPYTGKQWVTYTDTVSTSEQIHSESFDSTDVYVFDPSEFTLPESTELTRYQMRMYYTFDLEDGTCDKGSAYLYSNQFKERDPQTSPSSRPDVGIEVYNDTAYFGGGKYGLYRYTLEGETSVKAGEEVELTLYDNVSGTAVQDGYMLRILYRNGIMTTDLIPADEASFTFEEDMGPFVEVTGAYHCNGRFYRLPSYQITQNTSERTITVTHETDRESYSPGDTVTLTVRTEDHTGAPVSCTVNVSVVNEAIFVDRPQYTNIVYALLCDYASKYPAYSFSTYYDHELYYFTGGMGGGGGDDPRTNFADTACFETVTTDENGLAVITFTLPDSVTEYRITTHAAKGDMMYGATTSNFSAKMDFFLQSNPPRGQKHTDDFVAYATTVSEVSGRVDFTFTLKETGQTVETYADAGGAASANFGKLPTGTYTLRVDASLGEYSDAVEYPIEVEAGNMTNAYTQALTPDLPLTFSPSSYPVKVEIYTETAERYLKYFEFLQGLPATRLDTAISSVRADRLYNLLLERNESERYMRINEDFISGELLCIFADGAEDTVLSALCSYYAPELYRYSSSPWADTPESHLRSLMLSASVGRCTISELRCAERYITDEEHTAIIGLSYAFLGDYDNAKRMYGALPERSDIRGADALRAILATFVDRENASLIIDTLIGEESDEYYLGFALLSYLTHRISIMNEEHAVTLTVNGTSSVHSVNGLQIAELFLESQGTPDVTVSYTADDSVRVRLTYVDYEQIPDTADLYAWIEGDLTKYGTAYLMIDLSGYSGRKSLCIALPSSLRVNGSISSDGAYGYGKHEHVSITASKSFEGVVRVPLLVTQSGNYTVEPIRLTTEAGNRYYSNEITVDIG